MTPEEFATIRRHLGLKQHELAAWLDCDRGHISRMESGAKPITPSTALLMRAFATFGLPSTWPDQAA